MAKAKTPVSHRVLPTLEPDGTRRWLQPRLAKGRLFKRRRIVAYLLIVLLTALPLIEINGKPSVLLDVPSRQFTLMGYTFLPTDTMLMALLGVAWFASIFFFTALVGRAWCGWTCPHTVYMEFVFRPIERLCLGRAGVGGRPVKGVHALRYVLMYALFAIAALLVTHTLLSYFVGVTELSHWIRQNPADHLAAFAVIAISSLAIFYNFAFFREQMCTIACPYGRFQSVLIDRNSIGVHYDRERGEPRRRGARRASTSLTVIAEKKAVEAADCRMCDRGCTSDTDCPNGRVDLVPAQALPILKQASTGDCVDCLMCVQVCPMGIDIRDGTQLECVNCTQCIDACDAVMHKMGRPTGLVGYHSESKLTGGKTQLLRPRIVLYGAITLGFSVLLLILILTKRPFDLSIARNVGMPFSVTPSGQIDNTLRLTIRNRTHDTRTYSVSVATNGFAIPGEPLSLSVPAGESLMRPVRLLAESSRFHNGKQSVTIRVVDDLGTVDQLQYQAFAPGANP